MVPTRKPDRFTAEARADKLWRRYGFTSPKELVLEHVAMHLGVFVQEGPLDSADARLVRNVDRGLIRVKQDIPEPGRKRFAIAHELGHWLLHADASQLLACTNEDMRAAYQGSPEEVEANYFAAELLMPERLFRPGVEGTDISMDAVSALAQEFDTSRTAAAVRFAELSDDYCAVVFSEQGKIRWWRGSDRFRERFWIAVGQPLSPNTVAGSLFAGEPAPPVPEEVEAQEWLERGYVAGVSILEQSVRLEAYGQVISLLRVI